MDEDFLAPLIVIIVGFVIALVSMLVIGITTLSGQVGTIIGFGVLVWGFLRPLVSF